MKQGLETPYPGPTEAEALAAIGTSEEHLAFLAEAFGLPVDATETVDQ